MKILVIGDNSSLANAAANQLRQIREYSIVTTAWPASDLEHLPGIDLLVIYTDHDLDLVALRRLRFTTRLPILLIAPPVDDLTVVQFYAAGVDDHLVAPVSQELLAAKLRVWERWLTRLASAHYH